jgi:hypothetical protein
MGEMIKTSPISPYGASLDKMKKKGKVNNKKTTLTEYIYFLITI